MIDEIHRGHSTTTTRPMATRRPRTKNHTAENDKLPWAPTVVVVLRMEKEGIRHENKTRQPKPTICESDTRAKPTTATSAPSKFHGPLRTPSPRHRFHHLPTDLGYSTRLNQFTMEASLRMNLVDHALSNKSTEVTASLTNNHKQIRCFAP